MKPWKWHMVLLMAVGLASAPVFAAEMRVVGFIDNVFPHFGSNMSAFDRDTTRNGDQEFFGRQRNRLFFNFIASDDLRGVFGIEVDLAYGAPSGDRLGSGCVEGTGPFRFEQCGFRNSIDVNALEVKHLYVDFRVPQLPVGNRWRIGGFRFQALPLHTSLVYNIDGGGGDLQLTFTDQVSLLLSYQQAEEDLDRFAGSAKIGEDYITGATLMLKPIPDLDFHILGLYGHLQAPFGANLTGTGGPFVAIAQDARNVATEDRYYLGFDARWRIGNTRIEPTFVYLLGERKFTAASAALTGVESTDYDGFLAHLNILHTRGPWLFGAKFAYKSGNEADDDINNRGIGNRADVGFRQWATEADRFGEWFEILGRSEVDGVTLRSPYRYGEIGLLDRFGWMSVGGHVEYKATDNLILTGSVGGFWAAERPGCSANFRVGSLSGPCTGPGMPLNSSDEPSLNFTGDGKFVGWEINAGFRYTIMPGLVWTPIIAYADYGDALSTNNRKAMDAWSFSNRMIYLF